LGAMLKYEGGGGGKSEENTGHETDGGRKRVLGRKEMFKWGGGTQCKSNGLGGSKKKGKHCSKREGKSEGKRYEL